MPTTSFGTTVSFGGVLALEVRSVDVSGQSVSMIDTTKLVTAVARQVSGSLQNTTITVTCLDRPSWTLAGNGSELLVDYGGSGTATDYKTCVLTSGPNGSATIDAAVEFTYTFEQIDAGEAS
tara:strand:- start:696 stop:1061 length:366 start_codon:yes stop_codon:yes gene_type:complete